MLTQLPRIVPLKNKKRVEHSQPDPNYNTEFSASVSQSYIDNRSDFETFKAIASQSSDQERRKRNIPFEQKIHNSRHLLRQAYQIMHNAMVAISHGNEINIDRLHSLIRKLLIHMERHSDTILYLSREKRKEEYTYMRSVSFCVVLLDFGRMLGFSEKDLLHIGTGALLHDAGKMWIPPQLLNKPGRLSRNEFKDMREHIKFSEMILYNNRITNPLSQNVSLQHHERLDGSGYPEGLRGDQISEIGQISAIIDVYDALTSNRCYRTPEEPTHALKYLLTQSKDKFSEEYVQRFVQHVGIYPIGSTVKLSNNLVGVVVEKGRNLLRPIVKAIYDDTTKRLIPPSKIVLENSDSLSITQTLAASDLHFKPQRFLS